MVKNKKKIDNIIFFGSDYKVAQKLNSIATLKAIYCEKRHFNKDLYNYAMIKNIEIFFVSSLKKISIRKNKNTVGISYGVSWIFKLEQIQKFDNGIWNIHTGKLPDNRGRHPVSWSFLNNDNEFYISIHSINEEIDQGLLLAEGTTPRDLNDTQEDVMIRLNKLLIDKVIDIAFKNYYYDNVKKLNKGCYNESLSEKFDYVNPQNYTSKFIFNLFKSQYTHGGITIKETKYLYCDFYSYNYEPTGNGIIITCKDGVCLYVYN